MKFIKLSELRALEQKVTKGEISYSRMVEIINEMAFEFYSNIKK